MIECDRTDCKNPVDEASARMLAVELKSARVHTLRWWRFCNDRCRARWYAEGDAEDLLPISEDPAHLHPSDEGIAYAVHHVDKRGADVPTVSVHEALLHEKPESVNAYWKEPA